MPTQVKNEEVVAINGDLEAINIKDMQQMMREDSHRRQSAFQVEYKTMLSLLQEKYQVQLISLPSFANDGRIIAINQIVDARK